MLALGMTRMSRKANGKGMRGKTDTERSFATESCQNTWLKLLSCFSLSVLKMKTRIWSFPPLLLLLLLAI